MSKRERPGSPVRIAGLLLLKGTLGSYYSVRDYLAVNPEYGTMDEFKALVAKTHEMGMYVIIDWVANHTAWDNHLTAEHPDWYTKDRSGSLKPPVPDWSDVVDLDYDNPELRRYMIDAMKFWVREADIDGFRCDMAEIVPLDFWAAARVELDAVKPVFMLAEGEAPATACCWSLGLVGFLGLLNLLGIADGLGQHHLLLRPEIHGLGEILLVHVTPDNSSKPGRGAV